VWLVFFVRRCVVWWLGGLVAGGAGVWLAAAGWLVAGGWVAGGIVTSFSCELEHAAYKLIRFARPWHRHPL